MSWISAYYSSRDAETSTIMLLLLGICIGIAILVFFMVYLYRVERNTKDILWYLKTLNGQQLRSAPPEQENTQDQDEPIATDFDDDISAPETTEPMDLENKTESHGYIIATLVILGIFLFIAIAMAVTNS